MTAPRAVMDSARRGHAMTLRELTAPIGQLAEWAVPAYQVRVPVRVIDARLAYGRPTYQIEPVGGSGRAWVSLDRLTNMRSHD